MTILLTIMHVLVAVLLMTVILMQSGRGGGLTEGFASAESMFGAKTNEFMVRTTSVLLGVFIFTSLLLAYFSARKDQSLMSALKTMPPAEEPMAVPEAAPAVPETPQTP